MLDIDLLSVSVLLWYNLSSLCPHSFLSEGECLFGVLEVVDCFVLFLIFQELRVKRFPQVSEKSLDFGTMLGLLRLWKQRRLNTIFHYEINTNFEGQRWNVTIKTDAFGH